MRGLSVVLAGFALAGCATSFDTMRQEWPRLKGQPISEAVRRFGYPQSEATILGDKVYTWSSSSGSIVTTPTPALVAVNVGTVPISGAVYGYSTAGVTLSCEVKIATDAGGKIKTLQYDGNNAACLPFAEAMRRD